MNAETPDTTPFLKTQKTLTPTAAADILSFFTLGRPESITPINVGCSHSNYFVESDNGTMYVVRALGYVSGGVLANEVHLQHQLRQADISAPCMVASPTGEIVCKTNGISATVTTKLPGVHPMKATETDCFLAGQTLGRFHEATSDLPYQSRKTLLSQGRVIQDTHNTPDPLHQKQLVRLLDATSDLFSAQLPEGVMHGDLHAQNLLINEEKVSVLDLESASQGTLLLDIGRTAASMCCDPSGSPEPTKVTSLLEGYSQQRTLTIAEEALLPQAIVYGHLATASWLLINNFPNEGTMCLNFAANAYINSIHNT